MASELDQRFRQPVVVVLEEARRRGDVFFFVVFGLALLIPIGGGLALHCAGVRGPASGLGMWVGLGGGLAALLGLGALVWGAVRTQSRLPAASWLPTILMVLLLMRDLVECLETEPGPIHALWRTAIWSAIFVVCKPWDSLAALRTAWRAGHAWLGVAQWAAWVALGAGTFGPWMLEHDWLSAPWVWLWTTGLLAFATVGTLMNRRGPAHGSSGWSGPAPLPPSVAEEVRRLKRRSDVVMVLGGLFFVVVGMGSLIAETLSDASVVEPMIALVISGVVGIGAMIYSVMLDERVHRLMDKYRGRGALSRKDQRPKTGQ